MQEIKTVRLESRIGSVNCYLVKIADGIVLVDTGMRTHRVALDNELQAAGCQPGSLRLIIVTHGDADHASNAAFLRDKYGARIAMHRFESPAVERGSMLLSRKHRPLVARVLFSLFRLANADRFTPDIYVEDGDDLSAYGFSAQALHLPGHSIGSIGIVTTGGPANASSPEVALFCGDLMTNTNRPEKNTLVDDAPELEASVARVKGMGIQRVYPGHGKPFAMQELT